MKISILTSAVFFFVTHFANAQSSPVEVDVTLKPAGSFVGKTSEIKGNVKVDGAKVLAENVIVQLKNLKTGIELRDSHTQKYLETEKFPEAVLVKGVGENGKGTGLIRIRGIEKEIKDATYKVEGKLVKAEFELSLADFGIKGIRYMGVGVQDKIKLRVQMPISQ